LNKPTEESAELILTNNISKRVYPQICVFWGQISMGENSQKLPQNWPE